MDDLLPLPEPLLLRVLNSDDAPSPPFLVYGHTADQMHAYAAACVAAERERCAKLCLEKPGYFGSFANAELFAALIRGN